MKQELNLLDGYTPTNDLLNDAKQIIEVSQKAAYRAVNLAVGVSHCTGRTKGRGAL